MSKLSRKNHQMFSVYITLEEFINETITGKFWFVFEENSVGEFPSFSRRHCFREAPFFKMFPVHTKTQSQCFQILPIGRTLSKSSFFVTKLLLTVRLTVDMKQRVQFFRRSVIVASEWRDLGQKRVIVYIKTLPATYFTKENWH